MGVCDLCTGFMNPQYQGGSVFRLRLVELPMPTGSRDPDVLLAWFGFDGAS